MNAGNPLVGGKAMKVTTRLLIVAAGAVLLLALATVPSPAVAKSSSGAKVYKYKSDDLRLRIVSKGKRAHFEYLMNRQTCNVESESGWGGYINKEPLKVKNGRFGFKVTSDWGEASIVQLKAKVHKRYIQGWFLQTRDYKQEAEGDTIRCWSGESSSKPKIKFRARLVR